MNSESNREALVAGLLSEALDAKLYGAEWASVLGCAWLAQAYNGIGPEFLPETVRAKATKVLHAFEPAALIHDARTHESDGSRSGFQFAAREFRFNCLTLADRAYPWWNWKRYRARLVAEALYDAVSSAAGWKAWQDAHVRQMKNDE